jgi:hypothetical protein
MADLEAFRGRRVYARRPFTYAGQELAQGEVFSLGGFLNDEILVRLRYVEEVQKFKKFYEHGATGRKFIEAGYLEAFGRLYARQQTDLTIVEAGSGLYGFIDTTGDAEQRRLDQEAPLALDQTEATRR